MLVIIHHTGQTSSIIFNNSRCFAITARSLIKAELASCNANRRAFVGHPNVKVFITQGGLQSIEEAIAYHVPLLGLPIFGDQFSNVRRLEHLGLGLGLDLKKITKESLKQAILEIMDRRDE